MSWQAISLVATRKLASVALLCLVALLMYLPGQTRLPAIDRTEGVVALSSRYITESGDYLRPRWDHNLQRGRPAGTFWAQALSLTVAGDAGANDIATYRLPSLLSTMLAVVLLYLLASRLLGPVPAFMASLAVAVTPIVALHAQLAIAEPLVLPSIVAGQLALLAIYRKAVAGRPARWLGWLGGFWLAIGISTWFNALSVPLLALVTISALMVADRSWQLLWRLQPWFGLPLLCLLAVPWLAAVWAIDGGTLYRDMDFRAVLDALEGGQAMKFKTIHGVFVLTLLLGFVPVAHMLGPVVARFWQARRDPDLRFLLVWLIVPVAALELFSNKPPLYTVQAVMPAGALLVSLAVARIEPRSINVRAWPGMFWSTVVLIGVIAPLLFGGVLWITETPVSAGVALGFLVMAALFLVAAWVSARGYGMAWFASGVAGTFMLGVWFNGMLMPGLRNFWTAPQITSATERLLSCKRGTVAVSGFREPSLVLAARGRALTGRPEQAAKSFSAITTRDKVRFAIIESRVDGVFKQALSGEVPGADLQRLGCIRSFNLARGCALLFNVYATPGNTAVRDCKMDFASNCEAQHNRLSKTLKVPHCN